MREILFRGKRLNNGEWVEGFFVNQYGSSAIYVNEWGTEYAFDNYHVDINTVGQFTGLTDKNGKKIFEGDIVKAIEREHDEDENPIVVIGKMIFDDCCFGLKAKKVFDFYAPIWDKNIELEVIGNVYDNPELLKGE